MDYHILIWSGKFPDKELQLSYIVSPRVFCSESINNRACLHHSESLLTDLLTGINLGFRLVNWVLLAWELGKPHSQMSLRNKQILISPCITINLVFQGNTDAFLLLWQMFLRQARWMKYVMERRPHGPVFYVSKYVKYHSEKHGKTSVKQTLQIEMKPGCLSDATSLSLSSTWCRKESINTRADSFVMAVWEEK